MTYLLLTGKEEHALHISWVLFFQPLLFAFIGVFFDFSVFTWRLLFDALTILGIGVLIRILAVFLFVLCSHFNYKEKLFASICFIPKATVQAALAPPLTFFVLSNMETKQYANLVLQTCILSILITAPIGELLILLLGRRALKRTHVISDISSTLPPPSQLPLSNNVEAIPIETLQQHTYTKVDDVI
uniref:Cation/H+ exchanger domain-containing protein n=1 Tax=Panagrolaimus davidi TaxID=227884 RepID=A0A914R5U7_9BILA